MGLNKKQKKQLEVHRTKIQKLRVVLSNVKQQLDDPKEAQDLEDQIAASEEVIKKIKADA